MTENTNFINIWASSVKLVHLVVARPKPDNFWNLINTYIKFIPFLPQTFTIWGGHLYRYNVMVNKQNQETSTTLPYINFFMMIRILTVKINFPYKDHLRAGLKKTDFFCQSRPIYKIEDLLIWKFLLKNRSVAKFPVNRWMHLVKPNKYLVTCQAVYCPYYLIQLSPVLGPCEVKFDKKQVYEISPDFIASREIMAKELDSQSCLGGVWF